ncbi:hypothetical protein [Marinobacter segnicrescens]|uniref:hypothetical protein n=1 Tax=Marinobacter segnicrescens TaxID=430453 RepID=UPI003A92AC82
MSDMTSLRTQKRESRHSHYRGMSLVLTAMALMVAGPAHSQPRDEQGEVVTIEGTRIQGEQELPTVLYLVPWQPVASEGPEPMERRLMTGEPPASLERENFRRRLDYHRTRLEPRSQDTQE